MASLTSLPYEALKEVFNHINQHQALALAPLHSKFYFIAKSKLYRNIYVYYPQPLRKELINPNGLKVKFHYPKNINNRKSNMCTIISFDTFERYFEKMDATQVIDRLEVDGHDMRVIKSALKHFMAIKSLEIIRSRHRALVREDVSDNILEWLETYHRDTVFVSPLNENCLDHTKLDNPKVLKLSLGGGFKSLEVLNQFDSLIELTLYIYINHKYRSLLFTFKLHVLRIHSYYTWHTTLKYPLSKVFDTACLRELSIHGDFCPIMLFTNRRLEEEYPKLVVLCLRFAGDTYAPSGIESLKYFSHDKLRALVISTRTSLEHEARAICELYPQYPNSSINWWCETSAFLDNAFISHNMSLFSPNLPYGVVGYHFPHVSLENAPEFKYIGNRGVPNEVRTGLKRWYTRAELYALYDLWCLTWEEEFDIPPLDS
ncbi:hypothetical protein CANMA_004589 [Candida margitis]|uniref:uncharacterized protein n=1 Tax=Candida margitis TaxID=1775924 RepID=UPI002226BEC4|nr:uncharacterized protein CANMA_004589 [Candida margitis]KAI5955949.1 hypothetical protein CANMA_004589 [Candida margitis]